MNVAKRVGIIASIPLAATWFFPTALVGVATEIASGIVIGAYATGKYIATGEKIPVGKYLDKVHDVVGNIAVAPLAMIMRCL